MADKTRKWPQAKNRVSGSFSEGEIRVLEKILFALESDQPITVSARNACFVSVAQKIFRMRDRLKTKKEKT